MRVPLPVETAASTGGNAHRRLGIRKTCCAHRQKAMRASTRQRATHVTALYIIKSLHTVIGVGVRLDIKGVFASSSAWS